MMRSTIYNIRPTFAQELNIQDIQEKLSNKFVITDNGCWMWIGDKFKTGYGRLGLWGRTERGSQFMAHRIMYELINGTAASNMQIDHLCRVRSCVNPKHIELVTKDENNIRGNSPSAINSRKTHCPQGHLYSGYNLMIEKKLNNRFMRRCRTCRNKAALSRYYKKKEIING